MFVFCTITSERQTHSHPQPCQGASSTPCAKSVHNGWRHVHLGNRQQLGHCRELMTPTHHKTTILQRLCSQTPDRKPKPSKGNKVNKQTASFSSLLLHLKMWATCPWLGTLGPASLRHNYHHTKLRDMDWWLSIGFPPGILHKPMALPAPQDPPKALSKRTPPGTFHKWFSPLNRVISWRNLRTTPIALLWCIRACLSPPMCHTCLCKGRYSFDLMEGRKTSSVATLPPLPPAAIHEEIAAGASSAFHPPQMELELKKSRRVQLMSHLVQLAAEARSLNHFVRQKRDFSRISFLFLV